jgi:hypothetical protein
VIVNVKIVITTIVNVPIRVPVKRRRRRRRGVHAANVGFLCSLVPVLKNIGVKDV